MPKVNDKAFKTIFTSTQRKNHKNLKFTEDLRLFAHQKKERERKEKTKNITNCQLTHDSAINNQSTKVQQKFKRVKLTIYLLIT